MSSVSFADDRQKFRYPGIYIISTAASDVQTYIWISGVCDFHTWNKPHSHADIYAPTRDWRKREFAYISHEVSTFGEKPKTTDSLPDIKRWCSELELWFYVWTFTFHYLLHCTRKNSTDYYRIYELSSEDSGEKNNLFNFLLLSIALYFAKLVLGIKFKISFCEHILY